MATTATLNGGPTGGLHATPTTLIHSENPPQEETCRVESNSSFESGNDEILQHSGVLQGDSNNPSAWSTSSPQHDGFHDRSFDSESQAMDYRGSKKRRKQSRPVRIPATEMSALGAREHGSLLSESAGTGSEGDEAGELSSEREMYHPEGNSNILPLKHRKSDEDDSEENEEGELRRPSHRQQLPLNLTGKYQPDLESRGQAFGAGQGSTSVLTSCLSIQPSGCNSSIETDKTEAAGLGTKRSSHSPLSRIVQGSGSPQLSRQQFSPPIFSINNSSPFSALFPSSSSGGYFHQGHSQNLSTSAISQGNLPPGTPNSTSSTGSNQNGQSGGGSASVNGMPPHRIFNPEAYCDLCNKEFCNKYFLKTHKANKHGVYSELPTSASITSNQILAAAMTSSPSSSSFMSLAAPHGAPSSSSNNPLSQCLSQQQATSQPTATTSSSSNPSAGLLKGSSTSSTAAESSFTSAFSTGNTAGGKSESGGSNNSSQHQKESFCELCQKEFCNKYFLKRHKAKIHGIHIPEGSSNSNSGKPCSKSSSSSRQGFTNGMNESVKRSSADEGSMPGLASLREMGLDSLGLDLVTKHLEDGGVSQGESGQRGDNDIGHSDESNAPPSSLNSFQTELMLAATGGREGTDNARLRSPDNSAENASSFKLSSLELKSQQMGAGVVMNNAENTCQFCFREFPSQQLLRSHIIKKHRLLLQSAFPPFLLSFQPMPPSGFDDPASEGGVLDSNGNATEMDYECNICNRSFQTIYLLRMHKSYFHPESEQEPTDPLTSKLMSEAASILNQASGAAKSSNGREENEGDTDQGFDSDAEVEAKSDSANKSAAVENESRGDATSDSDDLRRLQTMIMELNRVSTSAVAWSPPLANVSPSPTSAAAVAAAQLAGQASLGSTSLVCPICSKEFYSSYFLQQHIQHYHASGGPPSCLPESGQAVRVKIESPLTGEITSASNASKKMNETGSVSGNSGGGSTSSQKDRGGDIGLGDPGLLNSPTFLTPGPKGSGSSGNPIKTEPGVGGGGLSGSGVKRPSPSLSRSYCTICHKELCNKYFMRTHMLKMHGISIESSTGLGGVTCDICNKELCSKYFLKVHKQNTHGIIEDGPSPPNPSTPGPTPPTLANFPIVTPPILNLTATGDAGSPLGQGDMSPSLLPKEQNERYFNHFSEVCPLCGRRFRSSKWLKSHLQSDHGQEGREKWKAIEKSLNLQRRSPKMKSSSNNGSSSKGSVGGPLSSSGGKSGSSSGKSCSTKDGNKCALCGFTTLDVEVMRAHLIKEHGNQLSSSGLHAGILGDSLASSFPEGSQGLVLDPLTMLFQKMEGGTNKLYRCSYCPFTTSLLVYLYAHERTHTGLANSVSNQNSASATPSSDAKCPFQCPMCFHTFSQPDAFQQHILGHQMSGVLAPFFTPSSVAGGSASQYGFLSGPSENENPEEVGGGAGGLLSQLPLLNGTGSNANSSLYLALSSSQAQRRDHLEDDDEKMTDKSEREDDDYDDGNEGAADLSTSKQRPRDVHDINTEAENRPEISPSGVIVPKKHSKISHFRCTCCHARFKTRDACISHIRQEHKGKRVVFKVISTAIRKRSMISSQHHHLNNNRHKRSFRCRKCKFTCSTYTSLMVHSKLLHSVLRPGLQNTHNVDEENGLPFVYSNRQGSTSVAPTISTSSGLLPVPGPAGSTLPALGKVGLLKAANLPEGRGVPQEGTVGEGEFMMQGFLLTSSEEESSNQSGNFVPSLVYLPVREKVSQSIRVSFSLTPTS